MIRFKEYFERYKGSLKREISLKKNPADGEGTLLYPLDKILPSLYNTNTEVHMLQKKLAAKKDFSIDEVVQANNVISIAEKAAEVLIETETHYPGYEDIAAKALDAGDKLDKVVFNEIRRLEKDFNKKHKSLKKRKHIEENLRSELLEDANNFSVLENIYMQRALSEEKISSTRETFEEYKTNLNTISEICQEIDEISSEYKRISSLEHFKDFIKLNKKKIKNSFLSKGDLVKRCIGAYYPEGIEKLKAIQKNIKYTEGNIKKIIKAKEELVKDLYLMRRRPVSMRNSMPLDKYDSFNQTALLSDLINTYKSKTSLFNQKLNTRKTIAAKQEAERKQHQETDLLNYWNNKWEKSPVVYHAKGPFFHDVRDFIDADNYILKEIIEKNELKGKTHDETAYNCMKFVQDNINYVGDEQLSGYQEDWLLPTHTSQLKAGDCEDGANLIISLMRNADIPAFRVKNACGEVPEGGHSWALYLRESDNQWVDLDWCYNPSKTSMEERETAKQAKDSPNIWFTFNDKYSWAQKKIDFGKDDLRTRTNAYQMNQIKAEAQTVKSEKEQLETKLQETENALEEKKFDEELDLYLRNMDLGKEEESVKIEVDEEDAFTQYLRNLDLEEEPVETISSLQTPKTENSFFSLVAFVQSINYPSNNYVPMRRSILQDKGTDLLTNLNSNIESLSSSKRFADNEEDLIYIESVHYGIKESFQRGNLTKFKKSPLMQKTLDNLQTYILESKKLILAA